MEKKNLKKKVRRNHPPQKSHLTFIEKVLHPLKPQKQAQEIVLLFLLRLLLQNNWKGKAPPLGQDSVKKKSF